MSTETINKKLFTVDDLYRMADVGILPEDGRFELIRGEIIEMPRPGSPHAGRVKRLNHLFTSRLGEAAIVSVQDPVLLDRHSAPSPDLALLKPRTDFYTEAHPAPGDVLLMVEVADTSVWYDTKVKADLYAEFKIPEYWLLDISKDIVIVRTGPADGEYRNVEIKKRGETIQPRSLPNTPFLVDEILGTKPSR
jgi:Uma2 family endonuclease